MTKKERFAEASASLAERFLISVFSLAGRTKLGKLFFYGADPVESARVTYWQLKNPKAEYWNYPGHAPEDLPTGHKSYKAPEVDPLDTIS